MVSYRRRRDLMLKNHSMKSIFRCLSELVHRHGIVKACPRGRPCVVPKHELVSFLLLWKAYDEVLERMELDSEAYLGKHYDHSSFAYHYRRLPEKVIHRITWHFERLIMQFLEQEILISIYDSTAISTSVREERLHGGTRRKEKLTQKFHTTLGYDPGGQFVVVRAMLATDHHTSDAQGALRMMEGKDWKGYDLGDSAYETYTLIRATLAKGRTPIYKPTKKAVKKKLSAKAACRKAWKGNPQRLYKELRGVGEVLYGAATRAGLLITHNRITPNQHKDSLIIGLRQNLLTYLRLEA